MNCGTKWRDVGCNSIFVTSRPVIRTYGTAWHYIPRPHTGGGDNKPITGLSFLLLTLCFCFTAALVFCCTASFWHHSSVSLSFSWSLECDCGIAITFILLFIGCGYQVSPWLLTFGLTPSNPPCPQTGQQWRKMSGGKVNSMRDIWRKDSEAGVDTIPVSNQCLRHLLDLILSSTTNILLGEGTSLPFRLLSDVSTQQKCVIV